MPFIGSLLPTDGWRDFETGTKNHLASAPGTSSSCPEPSSSLYEEGLVAGYFCLQILLEDGGANDVDGHVNGSIDHLRGLATPQSDEN